MFNKLVSIATRRNVILSLIAAFVFIIAMNIGATMFFQFTKGVGILDTGGGANLLDNRNGGYSPESAYQMISAYGSQGIRYHLMLSLADVFFPPTLALFLLLTTVYLYAPFFQSQPLTRWLTALSIVYLFSDYMENVGIATMLLSFPAHVPSMARLANFMFMLKNLSANAAIVAILFGLILLGVRRMHKVELKQPII